MKRYGELERRLVLQALDDELKAGADGDTMTDKLEREFAQAVGVEYAIAMNSGTSALHAALAACDVGYGDEVIMPPLTVISNWQAVIAQNAVPIFADVRNGTFLIDAEDAEMKVTSKTKAILPVSLYGLPYDVHAISRVAKAASRVADAGRVFVIADECQALGATYEGESVASLVDIAVYSFQRSKHLSCGDGGIAVTNNSRLALNLRRFAKLGYYAFEAKGGNVRAKKGFLRDPTYIRHESFGFNYSMPEVAAALALAQVRRRRELVGMRRRCSRPFLRVLNDFSWVTPQQEPADRMSSWWTVAFTIDRDDISFLDLRDAMLERRGDGPYAAWRLIYDEDAYDLDGWRGRCPPLYDDPRNTRVMPLACPVADLLQPRLVQIPLAMDDEAAAGLQASVLYESLKALEEGRKSSAA